MVNVGSIFVSSTILSLFLSSCLLDCIFVLIFITAWTENHFCTNQASSFNCCLGYGTFLLSLFFSINLLIKMKYLLLFFYVIFRGVCWSDKFNRASTDFARTDHSSSTIGDHGSLVCCMRNDIDLIHCQFAIREGLLELLILSKLLFKWIFTSSSMGQVWTKSLFCYWVWDAKV